MMDFQAGPMLFQDTPSTGLSQCRCAVQMLVGSPVGKTDEKEEEETPNFALLQSALKHAAKVSEVTGKAEWLSFTLLEWSQEQQEDGQVQTVQR